MDNVLVNKEGRNIMQASGVDLVIFMISFLHFSFLNFFPLTRFRLGKFEKIFFYSSFTRNRLLLSAP